MHQDYATVTAAIPLLAHPTPQQILGARLTVACHARSPDDCRLLLDVLGLDTTTAGPWQRPQQPLNSPPMNQNREQLVAHQADVYVDVTPEQRGVLWDYVHRALCEAGLAEGAAEQLADRMLAALTVEDTATVERISRTYHRQPLSRRPDQQPIRTREDLADVVAHVAPGVAREQAEQVAERLMPRLTRRDALIRAQRTQIEELLAQLDRYRLAWRSARRRAAQYRDDRDEYQRIAAYCQQSLRRDGVPTDIDVEEEVRDDRDHAQAHRLAQAVDHDTPLPYRTGDWVSRRGSQEIVRVTGVVYYGPRRGHIYTATGTRWGHGPAAPDEYELVHRDSTDTHGPTELQEGPDQ